MQLRKFKLGNVRPNPFRDLAKYPLIKEQVAVLKGSLEATRLWPMSVRINSDGEPEIPYGHHRLQAAIDLWGPDYEQTFVVEQIDDDEMLRRMADENAVSHAGGAGVQHAIMCVRAAKAHLASIELDKFIQLTGQQQRYEEIGCEPIATYFGKGPLAKSGTVKKVLPILKAVNERGIPEDQILRLPNLHQAETFVREFVAAGYEPSMTKAVVDDLKEHLTLVGGGTTPNGKSAKNVKPEDRLTAKNIASRIKWGGVFEPKSEKKTHWRDKPTDEKISWHLKRLQEGLEHVIGEAAELAGHLREEPSLRLGGFNNDLWKELDHQREQLRSLMSDEPCKPAADVTENRKLLS